MLKIRLARHGRKGRPFYRVVVQDSRKARDGRFVENVGHYDPLTEPATFHVDHERVKHWLSHGAQTVHRFLAREGLIEPFQPKPRSKRADAKRAAAAAAAAAE